MSASGVARFEIEAFDVFPASAFIEAERTISLGKIATEARWRAGAGSGDLEVAIAARIRLASVTGNQVTNLSNFTSHAGAAQAIANLKACYILNEGTNALDVITIGGGTTPFLFGSVAADTYRLNAGGVFVWEKRLGAGVSVTGANNIQLAFGSRTFSATIILLGH